MGRQKKLQIGQLIEAITITKGNKQAAIDMLGITYPTWLRYEAESIELQERIKTFIFHNRDRVNRRKNTKLRMNFKISLEEYNAMHEAQNGVCEICGNPETKKHWSGKVRKLAVDHNHQTGKIRGLLCSNCNFAIGLLKDNKQTVKAAFDYLDKH